MATEKRALKMALIAGASHALDYKKKNPRATDDEALRQVSIESEKIIRNIDFSD